MYRLHLVWLALVPAVPLGAQSRVSPVFETGEIEDSNVDSCAVWVAPEGVASLLFITEKDGDRIEIWNASTGARHAARPFLGETVESSLPGDFDRPNGVWVIPHVPHTAGFADVLLVTDQENLRVQVFRLPGLEYFGEFGTGEVGKGYGIAPFHDGTDFHVFITDNIPPALFPGKIKRYRLRPEGDGVGADLLFGVGASSGTPALPDVESVVADLFHDRLHVCGDESGTRNFVFRLDGTYTGTSYGAPQFEFNQEGINLHDHGGGRGYLIVSDQHTDGTPNEFEVFDRATLAHIGVFTSPPGDPIVTTNTDGAYLEQRPLPGFPNGAFYAVNDDENAHAYDWTDIAEAMGLEIVALDRPFPGRGAGATAGSVRALWFHDSSWWGALPREGALTISRLEDGTFAPVDEIAGEAPASVWSSGENIAILLAAPGAEVQRFLYERSRRRYVPTGDPILLPGIEGPLADLTVEMAPPGGRRGWIAWSAGGEVRAISSDEDLASWNSPGAPLGDSAAVAPRLVRLADATVLVWAEPAGAALRLHLDGDEPPVWQPAEPVATGPIASLSAAALPDGRIIVAGSSPGGAGWIRVRSGTGAWTDRSIAGDVRAVALSVDADRGRAHLFHGAEVSGRAVLRHREASLADLAFGPARLGTGWPGVHLEAVSYSAEVPAGASDAVAAAFGDDGLGYFARVPLPAGEDHSPPIVLQVSPRPGEAAAEGSIHSFRLTDDLSGADRSMLRVLVDGEPLSLSVRGVPRNLLVSFVLPAGLGETGSIRIEAADLAPESNTMTPFEYEIEVIGGAGSRFRRGDANGDEVVDVSDAVRALLVLFAGAPPPACLDALDAGDDGLVDVTDPIVILGHLFGEAAALPAPGAACGTDPTADDLSCPGALPCD